MKFGHWVGMFVIPAQWLLEGRPCNYAFLIRLSCRIGVVGRNGRRGLCNASSKIPPPASPEGEADGGLSNPVRLSSRPKPLYKGGQQ